MNRLSRDERDALLERDIPAHVATLDGRGYPRLTPLWFLYEDGVFYMTSVRGKTHLMDISRDPRVSLIVEEEDPPGARTYRRVKVVGRASLADDDQGRWTRRITLRYLRGPDGPPAADRRASRDRVLIALRPDRLIATRSHGPP